MNGHVGKKGVLTSRQEILLEPKIIIKNTQNLPQQKNIFQNEKYPQFAQSIKTVNNEKITIGHQNQFQYGTNSSFIPPPPERFLVNSHHLSSNQTNIHSHNISISPQGALPIYSNHQIVQPLYQSIKKTYVPHHIYNEIPVLNSQTKHYYENQKADEEQAEQELNQSEQNMLHQYQILYQNYLQEKQKNQHQKRQIDDYEQRLKAKENQKGQNVRIDTKIVEKKILIQKKKKLDIKLLTELVLKKKSGWEDILNRHKNSCISKLRALFSEEESNMKSLLIKTSQQFVVRK